MKQSKQETTLNEKDALQDILDAEKLLMNYYSVALTEGSCKSFRKEILKNYTAHAETQFPRLLSGSARGEDAHRPKGGKLLQSHEADRRRLKNLSEKGVQTAKSVL